MRIGRRPPFFLALCIICLVLVPFTPAEFRWVNVSMGALALFWAILLAIEDIATARRGR